MKVRISLLNLLFLLMFWWFSLPLALSIAIHKDISLADDYTIQLLSILFVSLLTFILFSVLHIKNIIWSKINSWLRYVVIMVTVAINMVLINFVSSTMINLLDIPAKCGGGSPLLLMAILIFPYAALGFVWTLIVWLWKKKLSNQSLQQTRARGAGPGS